MRIRFSPEIYDAVLCHHEHFNGLGYPAGLAGSRIPLIARLMSISDVVDALLSPRSYKPGWPPLRVRTYLVNEAGIMFDGHLARLAIQNFERVQQIRTSVLNMGVR
ncbi:hypothetical protein AA13594_2807 [Gluconacetobacter azotocaptans DSM 13594]|nr:hypothetical protein AA13594_2807 [Gluconacetobacter azotocaptans DSM 13594]